MDKLIEQAIKNCKINKYEKYFEQVCKEYKCLLEAESKQLNLADVMPSNFTLKQENAIWAIIQYLAKEQFQNPRRVYKRKDVFDLIKAEMDW